MDGASHKRFPPWNLIVALAYAYKVVETWHVDLVSNPDSLNKALAFMLMS